MPCNGNVARLVANVKTHHRHPSSSTEVRRKNKEVCTWWNFSVLVQESSAQNAIYALYTIACYLLYDMFINLSFRKRASSWIYLEIERKIENMCDRARTPCYQHLIGCLVRMRTLRLVNWTLTFQIWTERAGGAQATEKMTKCVLSIESEFLVR